jgi:hypothetical protein
MSNGLKLRKASIDGTQLHEHALHEHPTVGRCLRSWAAAFC